MFGLNGCKNTTIFGMHQIFSKVFFFFLQKSGIFRDFHPCSPVY
ncbi:hypothetical protein EVA_16307 [gut metagenome]|uniref:Uncharacterized protein n=1 Tax=gut metagenome TaxID=749906 RepID=J9C6Z1_9ZZZZ